MTGVSIYAQLYNYALDLLPLVSEIAVSYYVVAIARRKEALEECHVKFRFAALWMAVVSLTDGMSEPICSVN